MKLYIVSMFARMPIRIIGDAIISPIVHSAMLARANSPSGAMVMALTVAKQKWPESKGWIEHAALPDEVEFEYIESVYFDMRRQLT